MRPGEDALTSLRKRFNYHKPPNDDVVLAHEKVRGAMFGAAMRVVEVVPEGREQSVAITKLEEAMMWANAAIARNPEMVFLPDHDKHIKARAEFETDDTEPFSVPPADAEPDPCPEHGKPLTGVQHSLGGGMLAMKVWECGCEAPL